MNAPDLPALARKYRTLLALRADHDRDGRVAAKDRLRALAGEFPGALRELDAMPAAEMAARAEALEAATEAAPWMAALGGYHAMMRAALAIKRAYAEGGAAEGERVRAAVAALREGAGITLDGKDLAAIAAPPGGRLGVFVFERLGRELGREPAELWQATFPTGRADRFVARSREEVVR